MKPWWKAWFRRIWLRGRNERSTKDHPSVELLAAYHEDRLPPEEDEEIQEHFVDCPECPELMLDLDRFTSPEAVEAATKELPDTWVESAWRRLRSRLADEVRPLRSFLRRFRNPLLAWSCTACLMPCTLFLWLRVESLGEEVRALEAPQLNPPWWEVDAAPIVRGTDPPPPELAVPAGARRFLLVLLSADVSEHLEYRLEIRNGKGESIWEERGLHKNEDGAFIVTLSRGVLPAGLYLFRVTGIAGGEDVPFTEEFPVRLTYR
jgi:putative zinc finger protein